MNQKVKKLFNDIKSIKIQGATNVALATLEGMRTFIEQYKGSDEKLLQKTIEIGEKLSLARENEPLARNAVKYIVHEVETSSKENTSLATMEKILNACDAYEGLIENGKIAIIEAGTKVLSTEKVILTHCHSSTAITTLRNVVKLSEIKKQKVKVVATETRPLYQGRKTAKELYEAGVDVTLIADSAAASFIIDDRYMPVGAVIVGCDELLKDGSFINKVGTYAMAVAAQEGADEFYVATSLLKLDPDREISKARIEQREAKEVWSEAPVGLKIINPAFDRVKADYVTGYVTEVGVIKAAELVKRTREIYPWLFRRK